MDTLPGTAWDVAECGWWGAFCKTLSTSLSSPQLFFVGARDGHGLVRPLLYHILVSLIATIFTLLAHMALWILPFSRPLMDMIGIDTLTGTTFIVGLSLPVAAALSLVGIPLALTVELFFQTVIVHVCLLIVGGASRSLGTTWRAIAYSAGPRMLSVIPILGGVVGGIWRYVLIVIGLATAHRTSFWRSGFALLLPLLLCAWAFVFFLSFLIALVVAAFLGGM